MNTPKEIDTRLGELLKIKQYVTSGAAEIKQMVDGEVVVDHFYFDENGTPLEYWQVTAEMQDAKLAELKVEIDAIENLHRENQWTRWELVSGGKLHKYTTCSTLDRWRANSMRNGNRTPRITVFNLSGMTWEEATEATGVSVCTKCCPEAK